MTNRLFNVAAINLCTEAEGPYKRMAIWFQGCDIHCEGCCNPELTSLESRNIIDLKTLMAIIRESKKVNDIEGVTFLGGEPTLQQNLSLLASHIHGEGLGIILFTGHYYEELDPGLKDCIDLIIDGPFIRQKIDSQRNLIGSSNQRIIDITGRYTNEICWFFEKKPLMIEISLDSNIFHISGDVISKLTF